jgi:hypothetical protein
LSASPSSYRPVWWWSNRRANAAIVPVRDAQQRDTGVHRLAVGKVLAKPPVAVNNMTQTKLNVNMFTTDVNVQPGDSGSPALALQSGEFVLVGFGGRNDVLGRNVHLCESD